MKSVIIAALAVGFIACNSDQKTTEAIKNTDLTRDNLKGKVQTMEERTVNLDSTGASKADSTLNISSFNKEGLMTNYVSKDSSGKTSFDQTISHNADGTFSEAKNTKDGKQVYRLVTEVDKNGNYIGGKTYDSTGQQDGYYGELKTNESGIVYSGKNYFMNGKVKSTFDRKYDGVKFLGGSSTDSTGKTTYQGTIKVNEKGDMIEEQSTYNEKDTTRTENYTYKYDSYDNTGNWTQRTSYNDKGKPSAVTKRAFTYYKD